MIDSLHRAIWDGEPNSVKRLLDGGADPNARDPHGWTALSRAIERSQPEIAFLLIERGADCLAEDKRRRQPLLWAAQFGSDGIVEALLDRGAEAAAADDRGKTPLAQAIRHGRTATVKTLLSRGLWPKVAKNYRWTSGFFEAIRDGRFGIVEAFLDEGQSADSTMHCWAQEDLYERTALMEAALSGDLRIVDLLLRRGADIRIKSMRRSALTHALAHHGKHAVVTQTLLAAGAHFGLEEAVVSGDLAAAERLLVDGADAEMTDTDGQTLLTWAAFHRQSDAVRLLARFGADPNARNKYGVGALMGAAAAGDVTLAEFLIEHGADPDAVGPAWRQSALAYTAGAGQTEAARWFLERFGLGVDLGASALTAAASRNHLEVVRLLLDAGVKADAHTSYLYGRRALMDAAWKGNIAMTRLLLEHGADANAMDGHGRSAIAFAAGAGRKRVIPLLIEQGLLPEQKDKALLEALQAEHSDTAELLLQGGADPNAVGYYHRTALMLAAKNGRVSLVQTLLNQGAAPDALDKDGKTALIWAERAGRADIAALLRRYAP